jgi:hypothetical protein
MHQRKADQGDRGPETGHRSLRRQAGGGAETGRMVLHDEQTSFSLFPISPSREVWAYLFLGKD